MNIIILYVNTYIYQENYKIDFQQFFFVFTDY